MPLIACPDCGRQISDAAPFCIGCGRPMSPTTATPAAPFTGASSGPGPDCPRCGGELTPFRTLHERGSAAGANAVRVAPPDRKDIVAGGGCAWVFGGAILVAATTWLVATPLWAVLAFVVAVVVLGRVARARNQPLIDERHRLALESWDRRRLCMRCGATVVATDRGLLQVEDLDAEIDELLRAGRKIEAVKLVRERTGLALKESLERVEARERGASGDVA